MKKNLLLAAFFLVLLFTSCSSPIFSITNIDNNASKPLVKNNAFEITQYATSNYGYTKETPINIGFDNEKFAEKNIQYFFNALEGKNGEKITYTFIENCCPFATKRSVLGTGTLKIYEVTFGNSNEKIKLYLNIFERGQVQCPKGFSIKKQL